MAEGQSQASGKLHRQNQERSCTLGQTPDPGMHSISAERKIVNDQLTTITAALLNSLSYSALSKNVIRDVVDQAEAIVAEINSRFKGAPSGDNPASV